MLESRLGVPQQILILRIFEPLNILDGPQPLLLHPPPLVNVTLELLQFICNVFFLFVGEINELLGFDVGVNQDTLFTKNVNLNSLRSQFQDLHELLKGVIKLQVGKPSSRPTKPIRQVLSHILHIFLRKNLLYRGVGLVCGILIEVTHVPRRRLVHRKVVRGYRVLERSQCRWGLTRYYLRRCVVPVAEYVGELLQRCNLLIWALGAILGALFDL